MSDNWVCEICGNVNSEEEIICEECGSYRDEPVYDVEDDI